jgi:hypothetical protein
VKRRLQRTLASSTLRTHDRITLPRAQHRFTHCRCNRAASFASMHHNRLHIVNNAARQIQCHRISQPSLIRHRFISTPSIDARVESMKEVCILYDVARMPTGPHRCARPPRQQCGSDDFAQLHHSRMEDGGAIPECTSNRSNANCALVPISESVLAHAYVRLTAPPLDVRGRRGTRALEADPSLTLLAPIESMDGGREHTPS